jgi:hypothetical protein
MVNYILPRGGGAVKPPSLPSDSPHTLTAEERTAKERAAKERTAKEQRVRARAGMGYYKLLMARTRELIERLNLEASYHRAVLGTIARALNGRVVDYDEYLGRLTQLGPEIAARAQRESRSDLCYWLKRRLFPRKKICARCKAETDGLIEGLCSRCYREVAHEDARTCRCGAAL